MQFDYFQMVDRVETLDLEARVLRCHAQVPDSSTIFEGHFPGHPIMPGVLLIESMAQTSGYLMLALAQYERMPFLAGVKDAKLRSFVRPAASLVVAVSIEHEGSGYTVTRCQVEQGGKTVAEASIMLRSLPFPSPELKATLRGFADRIGMP